MDMRFFFWCEEQCLAWKERTGIDLGFQLYSRGHLLWLLAIVVACAVVSTAYCRLESRRRLGNRSNAIQPPPAKRAEGGMWLTVGRKRQQRVRKFFAVALLAFEVWKDGVLLVTGYFTAEYLPFHLCGWAILALLVDAFVEEQQVTGQLIAFGFVPGAISALLFCNWTTQPFWNFMSIHSFVFHGWIVCYGVMRWRNGEIRPSYGGLWMSVLMLVVLTPPLFAFNRHFGTNFLFINEASEGSPLMPLWNTFGTRFGYPGYLLSALILAIVVLHGVWLIYKILEKGRERKREVGVR